MTGSGGAPRDYLRPVRDLYEHYAFPRRDPEDERERLVFCALDLLGKLNHYLYAGRQDFGPGFRALVAGGGTGDAAIFLAEQLRARGGGVTYLDITRASMEIAQARARVRGLDGIEWVHGSILDLPKLDLGRFQYINCAGVLHHLADPDDGLAALRAVLAEDGGMGVMVYGKYGRADVYITQHLLRLINRDVDHLSERVDLAKAALRSLAPANGLIRGRDASSMLAGFERNESNLVDTFLHAQDRAYGAVDLHAFVAGAGLRLVEFTNFVEDDAVNRLEYDPALYVRDPALLTRIQALPMPERQEIAEIMNGYISLHSIYLSPRGDSRARFDDPEQVPYFLTEDGARAALALIDHPGGLVAVALRAGLKVSFTPREQLGAFLRRIDGQRSLGEIDAELAAEAGQAPGAVLADLAVDLDRLNAMNWLVLRHRSAPPLPTIRRVGADPT